MIRLAIAGASGKMGKTILGCAFRNSSFKVTGALEHPSSPYVGKDLYEVVGQGVRGVCISSDVEEILKGADVLIDFTHPTAVSGHLKAAVKTKTACVIGTTGMGSLELQLIRRSAKSIPVVQSPNMSIGVNLLFKLAEITAKALDENYDIEIAEIHHRMIRSGAQQRNVCGGIGEKTQSKKESGRSQEQAADAMSPLRRKHHSLDVL